MKPFTTCPRCHGQAELVTDGKIVTDLLLQRVGGVRYERIVREVSFYACTACEWCEEVVSS